MLSISETGLSFSQLAFNAAEVHGADAEIGGDVMLRYALYNVGLFAEQAQVALLGRIAYQRNKFIDVMGLSPRGDLQHHLQCAGFGSQLFEPLLHVPLVQQAYDTGFYGFDGELARHIIDKAVQRRQAFVLEKELDGLMHAVVVKESPDTAFFYKEIVLRLLPFFQQNGFGRQLPAFLQHPVFVPEGIELGIPVP